MTRQQPIHAFAAIAEIQSAQRFSASGQQDLPQRGIESIEVHATAGYGEALLYHRALIGVGRACSNGRDVRSR
jgi:hypothetical protein